MITFNFIPFPYLSTERLVLRPLDLLDESEIFTLRSDAGVNEFLDRKKADSMEDARLFIMSITKAVNEQKSILWGISYKDKPALTGTICLWNIVEEERTAEIGYELLPSCQGKGIITEALPVVIEYGFEKMQLNTITAELHAGNTRSIKVLERNNFVRVTEDAYSSDAAIIKYLRRRE